MKRFVFSLALTSLVALVALPAVAADNGFYLGLSVGQSAITIDDISDGDVTAEFSGDDMAYKVFAGYRLLTFLAVEASYVDFGSPDDTIEGFDGTIEASITGFDAFAMGMLPLGIADIFVKVGVISWDADLAASLGDQYERLSGDGTDPAYGLGFQFRIKSFAVRGEIEYFDIEDAQDVFMYSIGGSYTF